MGGKSAAARSQCDSCELASIAHVCVRVSDEDRGLCQREPRYRRDPRLKNQRSILMPADVSLIRANSLLAEMEPSSLMALINQGRVRALYRGDSLYHQGDKAPSLFLMLDGCLKEYRTSPDGGVTVRRIVEAGDCLGEVELFLTHPHHASAEAIWDSRLLELPAEAVLATFTAQPLVASRFSRHLAQRLDQQTQELENAFWLSAPQRLAVFLMEMFPGGGIHQDGRLPFDKHVLAARLGMTPETLSRAFMTLKGLGVRTHNRCVYVASVERLQDFTTSGGGI